LARSLDQRNFRAPLSRSPDTSKICRASIMLLTCLTSQ
jgi:hypothetical protein